MWQLWQLSSSTASRPSSLLDIQDSYTAFCMDQAVAMFGNGVQNILDSITHKNEKFQTAQRTAKLNAILSDAPPEEAVKKSFAAPTPTKRRRRKK